MHTPIVQLPITTFVQFRDLSAVVSELGTAAAVPLLLTIAGAFGAALAIGAASVLFAVAVAPLWVLSRAALRRDRGVTIGLNG